MCAFDFTCGVNVSHQLGGDMWRNGRNAFWERRKAGNRERKSWVVGHEKNNLVEGFWGLLASIQSAGAPLMLQN